MLMPTLPARLEISWNQVKGLISVSSVHIQTLIHTLFMWHWDLRDPLGSKLIDLKIIAQCGCILLLTRAQGLVSLTNCSIMLGHLTLIREAQMLLLIITPTCNNSLFFIPVEGLMFWENNNEPNENVPSFAILLMMQRESPWGSFLLWNTIDPEEERQATAMEVKLLSLAMTISINLIIQ